jgi:hypothetical protein
MQRGVEPADRGEGLGLLIGPVGGFAPPLDEVDERLSVAVADQRRRSPNRGRRPLVDGVA